MNDALEMLEYTTILNQIAELTHTEAARRRALELRPTKDLALIHQRAHWIGQAARCLEVSAPPLTAITGVEAALPLLKLNEILSTDHVSDRLPKDAVVPRPHEGNRITDRCLAVFHRRAAGAGG